MNKQLNLFVSLTTATALSLGVAGTAQAATIDFETTPNGLTPIDNAQLDYNLAYEDNGTLIQFGFDTNDDLVFDANAIFEKYGGDDPGLAYFSSVIDLDKTISGEGGDWFLRPSGDGRFLRDHRLIIKYSGNAVNNASGQIWDVDGNEAFLINALDTSGNVIDSIAFSSPAGQGPDTLNGLPFTFYFDNLNSNIGYITISTSKNPGSRVGFDNFKATKTKDVPEPITGLVFAAGLGGAALKRAKDKSKKS